MRCTEQKKNGNRCEAHAISNSGFCYYHNPDIKTEDKRHVRSEGGRVNRSVVKSAEGPMKISAAADVVGLIESTINRVRAGKMEIRVANCIGFLSGHLLRALEVSDVEERMVAIEQQLEELSHD